MTTPSLFDLPPSPAAIGMARATAHAEADTPGWSGLALAFLTAYAGQHETFTGHEVVTASRMAGAVPDASGKAWGSVFTKAARAGIIAKTGRFVADPNRHGCPVPTWQSRMAR